MQTLTPLNRRQFISGLFCFSAAGFIPSQSNATATPQPIDHTLRVNTLIRVLQEHHMLYDDVLHESQKANLLYAFEKIKPTTHLEETIAVACSMSHQPVCSIVDEYVRRRVGKPSQLPDHPVMMLKAWGVPDTYRMLIFKEQIETLLAEVTEYPPRYWRHIYTDIARGDITEGSFPEWLNKKYQSLSKFEIKIIWDALYFYAPMGRPYVWCASMASRADALQAIRA